MTQLVAVELLAVEVAAVVDGLARHCLHRLQSTEAKAASGFCAVVAGRSLGAAAGPLDGSL